MNVELKIRTLALDKVTLLFTTVLLACSGENPETKNAEHNRDEAVFRKVSSSASGVHFKNVVEEKFENYFDFFAYVYNGGGVAIGDINNDDLPDLYFSGNEVPNKLYLNLGGLEFKDITESAGVSGGNGWDNGVTMVDINHDGLLDIYVCRGGWQDTDVQRRNLLFVNQGDLTFREAAGEFGLAEEGYSMQASFFDMDNDGDLDAYVANRPDSFYLPLSEMSSRRYDNLDKNRDKLYRNNKGHYEEVGLQSGIVNNYGYSLGLVTTDLNKDGLIDIFVANDYSGGDYTYINQGNGLFEERIREVTNHISLYSMGVDVSDINNDGWEDIMVMEMRPEDYVRSKVSMPSMDVPGFKAIVAAEMHKQYMHNMVHLNQGNLFFSEISQLIGVAQTDWSWAILASDFTNSGDRDFLVTNGFRRDVFDGDAQQRLSVFLEENRGKYRSPEDFFQNGFKDFIEVYRPVKVRNYLFRNNGELQFDDVSEEWGFHEPSFSNGAAVGDLDGDGDLDIVINNLEEEAFVYENVSSGTNHYLKLKIRGSAKNTSGLGAKVTVYHDTKRQYFENKTVRGYLSSCEPIVHFGLGTSELVDSVSVQWNDGQEVVIRNVSADQLLVVSYESGKKGHSVPAVSKPIFAEVTEEIFDEPFVHIENEFNEYQDQVLLPHMLSRNGPFLAGADVNSDGLADFYVGGASGHPGQLYVQEGGVFKRKRVPDFERDKMHEDAGVVFFDANQDEYPDLYVVSGGGQYPEGHELNQDRLYLNDGAGNFRKTVLPAIRSSGSCVLPHDLNGDGMMDLFVGGGVVPGRYPGSPRSYFLINKGGRFDDKTQEIAPALLEPGMVTSGTWADLTDDGVSELIIAGEWMPIKVFENVNGKLKDISAEFGLEETNGWWNKVVAEDLNNDGLMDLIVGNQGENYKFRPSKEKPLRVFAKDFDGNGTNDIFLAKMNKQDLVPVRGRECTSMQMPVIAQKFPSFQSFAEADLEEILGPEMNDAIHREAYMFSSMVLINENGKFTKSRLPTEAQLSSVNCIVVEDVNDDGRKDILIAGNKFDAEVETTPADASQGLLLMGRGNVEFDAAGAIETGFSVPYNVKDAMVIMVGGAWHVLITSNNDRLRIFRLTPTRPPV